jgi:hypothetical protein
MVLLLAPAAARPGWPRARAKLLMVAVLALVLDAGFLRSPLEARIADPSVPLAILAAWLLAAAPVIAWRRQALAPAGQRHAAPIRVAVVGTTLAFTVLLGIALGTTLPRRFEKASFGNGGKPLERAAAIADQIHREWRLEAWLDRPDRPELTTLAIYLNECTAADDRILVQGYVPQVLGLARRAFAGGHADLRPGFFNTQEAQDLTVSRLERQHVPVILLETGDAYANFRKSFPTVMTFIDRRYTIAASRLLDDRFGVTLFVRRDLRPRGQFAAFGWPCFGDGQVHS